MGRLVDTSELAKHIALQKKRFGNLLEVPICNVFADMIRDTPTAKAIPKADYENRLKADMVAMLEDLNLEIDEMFARRIDYTVDRIQDLIQQKIDKLKENNNESY
jgi:hypothetical protein